MFRPLSGVVRGAAVRAVPRSSRRRPPRTAWGEVAVLARAAAPARAARSLAALSLVALSLAACAAAVTPPADDAVDAAPPDSTPSNGTPPTTTPPGSSDALGVWLTADAARLPAYASAPLPAHLAALVGTPRDNTVGAGASDLEAFIGRVLFFDRRLSRTGTVSCASCHDQRLGFTDTARFSRGIDPVARTARHSMRLADARFAGDRGFFWDRRAPSLEAQVIEPIQDPVEMGFDAGHGGLGALLARMDSLPYYRVLMQRAYGDSAATVLRVQRALARYLRAIVSTTSRFDVAFAAVYDPAQPDGGIRRDFPGFTPQENRGKQLFLDPPPAGGFGCAGCHQPPTFNLDPRSLANGLDAGQATVFTAPSLKNVAVAGPYMHDGRFATLEQVLDFYVRGVQDGPLLDPRLRGPGGTPLRLPPGPGASAAVIAFLRTLTDDAQLRDATFGDPFRR